MFFDLVSDLKTKQEPQKWIAHTQFSQKRGITCDSSPNSEKVTPIY